MDVFFLLNLYVLERARVKAIDNSSNSIQYQLATSFITRDKYRNKNTKDSGANCWHVHTTRQMLTCINKK